MLKPNNKASTLKDGKCTKPDCEICIISRNEGQNCNTCVDCNLQNENSVHSELEYLRRENFNLLRSHNNKENVSQFAKGAEFLDRTSTNFLKLYVC